jgi:hypothetical protein
VREPFEGDRVAILHQFRDRLAQRRCFAQLLISFPVAG